MSARMNFPSTAVESHGYRSLYQRFWNGSHGADRQARDLIEKLTARADPCDTDLPNDPADLENWMRNRHQRVGDQYRAYLDQRAQGGPRRYFQCRAQALFFLRCIAPTKLVDGAWLHGLTRHWDDTRLAPLLRIYLEELGEGDADKNHVLLYQRLLARYGCENLQDLADDCYQQGALQLALGQQAEHFLPEVIGFNLGYEQLPLHLLITAHELAELDIDPSYFTLHITIDNMDVGHARKAQQSVLDMLPVLTGRAGRERFYQRVRRGFALNGAGPDTQTLLARFDPHKEVLNVLRRKAVAGRHLHPDQPRLGGRRLNDWLADLADGRQGPAFLQALQQQGWVKRGRPASQSRFWNLMEGERATMFGVFNGYERQVIHDWIVDDALPTLRRYRPCPRAARGAERVGTASALDQDVRLLEKQLADSADLRQRMSLLGDMIAPTRHFTPAGLLATRRFAEQLDRL